VNDAIVFVSDMARSVRFYRDELGIPLRFESPAWTELATDGATLALHQADATGVDEGTSVSGRSRPGFSVPDLTAFHEKMTDAGVPCVQPPKDVFGARVAQYADPDGRTLSFGEERKG
jgi:lactoylglutathione lyase